MTKNECIKIRVSVDEKKEIVRKAQFLELTVADFIRNRTLNYRLRRRPEEKEYVRQVARIGANLNQIARWANTYKNDIETMEILFLLKDIERALKSLGDGLKNLCI